MNEIKILESEQIKGSASKKGDESFLSIDKSNQSSRRRLPPSGQQIKMIPKNSNAENQDHKVRKQASEMNLIKPMSYVDEEKKGAESPVLSFQNDFEMKRKNLRTPINQKLKQKTKSNNTEMSDGDMIRTAI